MNAPPSACSCWRCGHFHAYMGAGFAYPGRHGRGGRASRRGRLGIDHDARPAGWLRRQRLSVDAAPEKRVCELRGVRTPRHVVIEADYWPVLEAGLVCAGRPRYACAARQRRAAERLLSAGADLNWEPEGFWLLIVRFDQGAAGATSPRSSPNLLTPSSLPFISAMVSRPRISSCPGNWRAPPVGPMGTAMATPEDS